MKNNKLKYVVLVAVAAIWVAVGKMIFFSGEEEGMVHASNLNNPLKKTEKVIEEVYELEGNYRDPFLSGVSTKKRNQQPSSKSVSKKQKPVKKQPKKEVEPTITWPTVAYLGVVQHSNNERQMHILRVNDKEELINQGESLNGVVLLKLNKDSVFLEYKGEKRKIKKSS